MKCSLEVQACLCATGLTPNKKSLLGFGLTSLIAFVVLVIKHIIL